MRARREPPRDGLIAEAVVGVDGRAGDRDAVALAVTLGARRITLVTVDGREPVVSRSRLDQEHALREDAAAVARTRRTPLSPEVVVEALWVDGDAPARALHEVARVRDASLIVVGSAQSAAHHGRVGRIVFGSVSRLVTHLAPCPVAIAPRGHRDAPQHLDVIGLGYDGSPAADAALRTCRALAASTGAAVEVHVVETELDHGERKRDQALGALGVGARGFVHHGDRATELARASRSLDLLVLGTRGLGTEARPGLDSTTDRIVAATRCPVLVVPRG